MVLPGVQWGARLLPSSNGLVAGGRADGQQQSSSSRSQQFLYCFLFHLWNVMLERNGTAVVVRHVSSQDRRRITANSWCRCIARSGLSAESNLRPVIGLMTSLSKMGLSYHTPAYGGSREILITSFILTTHF
jgi:hypothetical protein